MKAKNKSIQLRNNFSINKNLDFNIEDENQSYQISNTEIPNTENKLKKSLDSFDNRRLNDNLIASNFSKEPALYSYNPIQPTVLHKYNVKTLNYPKNNSLSEIKNKPKGLHNRSSSDYNFNNFNSIMQKRQIGNQLIDPLQNPSVLNILSNIFDEPNASSPILPQQEPIYDYINDIKENPYTGGRIDLNTMKNIKLNNPKYELEHLKKKYSNKMHLIKRIQRFYT